MKKIIFAGLLLLLTMACHQDEVEPYSNTKERLLGRWDEIRPCGICGRFLIITKDSIGVKYEDIGRSTVHYYNVLAEDSILFVNWPNEIRHHKLNFYSNDTLEIPRFYHFITGRIEDAILVRAK